MTPPEARVCPGPSSLSNATTTTVSSSSASSRPSPGRGCRTSRSRGSSSSSTRTRVGSRSACSRSAASGLHDLGLAAGVVTDRFDNRRTVIVTQSVQMSFSAVLAAITLLGHVQLWEVFTIAALTGTALVFDAPSRQNLTFQMVGRDELPNAIALNSSLFNTARIFGPALAGVLIAAFGSGWCFAINALKLPRRARRACSRCASGAVPVLDRGRPTFGAVRAKASAYARSNRTVLVIL